MLNEMVLCEELFHIPAGWVTMANMLTNLAVGAELFHIACGIAFADLMIDGHRETWPVRSKQ